MTGTAWPVVPLGAILTDIQPGFASGIHNTEGKGVPHFRPMNVSTDGRIDRTTMKYVASDAGRPNVRLRSGDVLFNNTNSPELVGKTALFEETDEPAFSNHMTRLRIDVTQAEPRYVAMRLHHAWREGWFSSRCNNHVSQASVSRAVLSSFDIELPPLPVQRALIEIYRKVDSHEATASSHLEAAKRAVERFKQAVLAAACSGRMTADWRLATPASHGADVLEDIVETRRATVGKKGRQEPDIPASGPWELPDEWAWSTPGQLADPLRAITYGVIKLGDPVPDGVPTLRSSDVRWLRIEADHVKRIARTVADNYRRTYLEGGEILVTVRGTLGGIAVVPSDMAGWNISREVAMVPMLPAMHIPYVVFAMASPQCQRWMRSVAKGVAYTGVNIEDLKKLPIPVPPLAEQREIARRVTQLFALADGILHRVVAATTAVEHTSQAVLAKAFRGELIV